MIDLYTASTPNGRKIPIMLEEVGLPYTVHALSFKTDEQKKPEYLAINPNGKIPAIVDRDGPGGRSVTVFESGAILIYLAEKTGQLLPKSGESRYETLQWLMFQMSAVGPMFGQLGYFMTAAPEKLHYAIERYTNETFRILHVLNARLGQQAYLAGEYSIADIATYPWVVGMRERIPNGPPLANMDRWVKAVGERPTVQKGMTVPSSH